MKKRIVIVAFMAFIVVAVAVFATNGVGMTGNAVTGMCLEMQVTSINPSSVGADEDFTVGVEIESCGEEDPQNVVFEIIEHSEDRIINNPLRTEIGAMN